MQLTLVSRVPFQYPTRRLIVRSHEVSKRQISERLDNSRYKSRGFETSRDLTIRRQNDHLNQWLYSSKFYEYFWWYACQMLTRIVWYLLWVLQQSICKPRVRLNHNMRLKWGVGVQTDDTLLVHKTWRKNLGLIPTENFREIVSPKWNEILSCDVQSIEQELLPRFFLCHNEIRHILRQRCHRGMSKVLWRSCSHKAKCRNVLSIKYQVKLPCDETLFESPSWHLTNPW